jgi:CcmD family protein
MSTKRRFQTHRALVIASVVALASASLAHAYGRPAPLDAPSPPVVAMQQPATPDGFVPVYELPQDEQLPAAPLLVGAYAFAWVMVLGYLWGLWRRLSKVEKEMAEVARRLEESRRG